MGLTVSDNVKEFTTDLTKEQSKDSGKDMSSDGGERGVGELVEPPAQCIEVNPSDLVSLHKPGDSLRSLQGPGNLFSF